MCLLRGTDWVFIYNSMFCPHSVFMCFVWIWEQTAIISLYSINWLVFFNRDGVCLLRGTDCIYIRVVQVKFHLWRLNLKRPCSKFIQHVCQWSYSARNVCLIEHRVMKTHEGGVIAPRTLNLAQLQVQPTLTPQKHTSSKFIFDSGLFEPQNPSG